jgi:hypothetical protein
LQITWSHLDTCLKTAMYIGIGIILIIVDAEGAILLRTDSFLAIRINRAILAVGL